MFVLLFGLLSIKGVTLPGTTSLKHRKNEPLISQALVVIESELLEVITITVVMLKMNIGK